MENTTTIQSLESKNVADDIIFKTYLSKLPDMEVVDIPDVKGDTRLFKITKMVYETEENATDKFVSVITAMSYADCSICLIVDGKGDKTDFYLGINSNDKRRTTQSIIQTFQSAIKGQFPGTQTEDISIKTNYKSEKEILLEKINSGTVVSLYSGIPTLKDKKNKYTNKTFIQGIEKFANAMKGKTYTAVILASNAVESIAAQREAYEILYSKLFSLSSQQRSYTSSESATTSLSQTFGTSNTLTESQSNNKTKKGSWWSALSAIPVAGFVFGSIGYALDKTDTVNRGSSTSTANAKNFNITKGENKTSTESENVSIKIQDKHIQEILKRIDKQLERISMFESNGLWDSCAYFVSYKQDKDVSETAATIFRSIMQGDDSGIERSSVNT